MIQLQNDMDILRAGFELMDPVVEDPITMMDATDEHITQNKYDVENPPGVLENDNDEEEYVCS